MRKSIVVLIALIAAVTIGSPAAEATKYCAPLPVASSGLTSCKCAVHNYSTVTDTGIHVTIYQGSGVANTCALTLAPKHGDIAMSPPPQAVSAAAWSPVKAL